MSQRTLEVMVSNVQRSLAAVNIPLGDIIKALDTANKHIHGAYAWPWTVKETNVPVSGAYSQGTISIADRTSFVFLSGGIWDMTWSGRRFQFGQQNVDYIVSSFPSPTTAVLAQPVNLGSDLVNAGYRVYQDTYEMPADWEPGKDFFLSQQTIRYRVRHVSQAQLESNALIIKQMSTNLTTWYADAGFNAATRRYQIRFMPPISQVGEYRMVYRARPADLTSIGAVSGIPEGWDECVEHHAEAELRRLYKVPGRDMAVARAAGTLKMLRKQISSAVTDDQPTGSSGIGDSSISQWGLSILPWGTS